MAKSSTLLLSLCIFAILSYSSLGRQQSQQGNECQIDRINAIEPDNTIQAEAGTIETWDPSRQQFQCAGVAMVRRTIEPNGLLLPSYSNTPQLIYIIKGRGHTGILFPGCPETFEESQQSGQQGYRGQQGTSQDQHQKVRRFREGDVIAIPAGVAHWCHNDGNEDVVTVTVHDTSSHLNQLDNNPRSFYLAGNPRDEFEQSQQSSQQKRFLSRRGFGQSQGSSSTCNNLFCGMDSRALAEAFNIDENLARKLQSENDNRGSIVRVEGELAFVRPPTTMSDERQEQGGRYGANGVEETFCSMRMRENIGDPSNADIFTPQAGRIRSLNSHNLPVLQWIQLSAERGVLYNEAIRLPHWNINAHSIVYAIRGQARVQIVNENGNSVFDGVLQEGQVVTVPQNFAVVKRAESERFEWVAFKTNDNAQVNTLAGRTSAIRAIPAEVLANAWRVSPEEARRLKFNRQETHLASTRSQSYRAEA